MKFYLNHTINIKLFYFAFVEAI